MPISPQQALQRCIEHHELSHDEMTAIMRLIMSGEIPPTLVAGLLVALRTKQETVGEITAAAQVMREFATPVHIEDRTNLVDVVGTGGDGAHTFNISTAAMFVAAAAGAKIAKHGNRSVSSKSGSADILESLGVNLTLSPVQVAQCIAQTGAGFMFAPNHHPAMKNVAPIRKDLGVRTIFNILGPLTNPADAKRILMGVFHADLVGIQIRVLQAMGMDHALVVYGLDGLDEISLEGPTLVGELKDGLVREYEIHPQDFGLSTALTNSFKVSNAAESKAIVLDVLNKIPGPASDIVCLNAGAVLYVADIAPSIASGIEIAKAAIASGAARQKLDQFVVATQK
ncbi:anthranilate phosphoribosyltransferase [Polynucleobacter sp. TUM22923]|jgi:anthranilate phosphoribosyltransferase|uniref:anthranilate phosphoribosyltransferase n=1 Tax=Polynucleobacter sp. TUM22923 TaxID=3022126 RepID=UPI0025728274|nr:anthranilate phosphoribosyltransferase [Polynucleobacter sp. TUM22923]BDX20820.1 anthranilate phosphoribosyltransferase [Polynucleobacter sp. TUM22923]